MDLTISQTAEQLSSAEDILILTHRNPDGDTLGSGFALHYAFCALGKRSAVLCSDEFPKKFSYFITEQECHFEPRFIVAVDTADTQLLGAKAGVYADRVQLCIDHHASNSRYAEDVCLFPGAAATAELIYQILVEMGIQITPKIADCLYTGISTDTGCFKFSNTTEKTHRIAADLFAAGADYAAINRLMFDTKSRSRVMVEQVALSSMEFHFDHRCAMIVIPRSLIMENGIDESELDGIAGIPRQIEGVEVGITLREKEDGYKISVRTCTQADAAAICARLGGGGHVRAAGCFVKGPLEEVRRLVLEAVGQEI